MSAFAETSERVSFFSGVRRSIKVVRLVALAAAVVVLFRATQSVHVPFKIPAINVKPHQGTPDDGESVPQPLASSLEYWTRVKASQEHGQGSSYVAVPSSSAVALPRPTLNALDPYDATDTSLHSRIGKMTGIYYEKITENTQAYEAALLTHKQHDTEFGYHHSILRRSLISFGAWSKLAYILSVLVRELQKAPAERLEWLFWHDADVVLLNSELPLEIFLPPEPKFSHINYIVSNDLNGMNDGVFFLRVCEWSIHFMAAGLSYITHEPEVDLRYDEQSALLMMSRTDNWKNRTLHMPQRWFNAYHHYGTADDIPPEWVWTNGYVEPGDFLVHLPGSATSRTGIIHEWLGKLRDERDKWVVPLEYTNYTREIDDFWEHDAEKEEETQVTFWRRYHVLKEVGPKQDDAKRAAMQAYKESVKDKSVTEEDIEAELKAIEQTYKQDKIEALRELYNARLSGDSLDVVHPE